MWLFWPMVFAVLGFRSVAYSEEAETFPTRRINDKALYSGFSVNLGKDLKLDEAPSSGNGSDETPKEEQTDGKPVSEDKPDDTPELSIISGFDVATWTLGLGTMNATGTDFFPKFPRGRFDVATGTLDPGLPKQNTSVKPLTLQEAIPCYDKSPEPKITHRNGMWIFHNYVPMSTKVRCWESVTFATHAHWFDLMHVAPLVERWRAPVSVAVAVVRDFDETLDAIRYVKSCTSPLVSQYVTFHVYFFDIYIPDNVLEGELTLSVPYDCDLASPLKNLSKAKADPELQFYYPNLGRNIARENSLTHYHIVANIDSYPSANLASDFLEMIRRDDQPETLTPNPKVFVLPPFEVIKGETVPFNKTELVKMLNEGKAVPFRDENRCPLCQIMPEAAAWRLSPESQALSVFFVGKRTGPFKSWEPTFIGTDKDPMYIDEILGEGTYDRRLQGWLLCNLDYNFLILDNAFVVRPPGIENIQEFDPNIRSVIHNDCSNKALSWYLKLYGENRACAI